MCEKKCSAIPIFELEKMKEMVSDIIEPKIRYTGDIYNMRQQANDISSRNLKRLLKIISDLIGG